MSLSAAKRNAGIILPNVWEFASRSASKAAARHARAWPVLKPDLRDLDRGSLPRVDWQWRRAFASRTGIDPPPRQHHASDSGCRTEKSAASCCRRSGGGSSNETRTRHVGRPTMHCGDKRGRRPTEGGTPGLETPVVSDTGQNVATEPQGQLSGKIADRTTRPIFLATDRAGLEQPWNPARKRGAQNA